MITINSGEFAKAAYDWWDLVPAIVGGVIGALAGGIPAWMLANRASREALERDQKSRQDVELSIAFRVHTKLGMMMNDLCSTLMQIREMLKRPVDPRDESPVQRRVSAFAGRQASADAGFTADELAIFVSAGEGDYLTDLDLFGRRYFAIAQSLDTYGALKAKLHEELSDSAEIKFGPGDTIYTNTFSENANRLRMQARTLESLIVPLIDLMEQDIKTGLVLANQFQSRLTAHFSGRSVPGFDFSQMEEHLPDLAPPTTSTPPPS